LNFNQLVKVTIQTNETLKVQATRAMNISLALRNWLIGYYIVEYRLNGSDHTAYGEKVFERFAEQLRDVSNCNKRQLYRYFNFYRIYPQIAGTLSPHSKTKRYSVMERLSYSHICSLKSKIKQSIGSMKLGVFEGIGRFVS
jgi:hypothetical protein